MISATQNRTVAPNVTDDRLQTKSALEPRLPEFPSAEWDLEQILASVSKSPRRWHGLISEDRHAIKILRSTGSQGSCREAGGGA